MLWIINLLTTVRSAESPWCGAPCANANTRSATCLGTSVVTQYTVGVTNNLVEYVQLVCPSVTITEGNSGASGLTLSTVTQPSGFSQFNMTLSCTGTAVTRFGSIGSGAPIPYNFSSSNQYIMNGLSFCLNDVGTGLISGLAILFQVRTPPPTLSPTHNPSASLPTRSPTLSPSSMPTPRPTLSPTRNPSLAPTFSPSSAPSLSPSLMPSRAPSRSPSTAAPTWPALPILLNPPPIQSGDGLITVSFKGVDGMSASQITQYYYLLLEKLNLTTTEVKNVSIISSPTSSSPSSDNSNHPRTVTLTILVSQQVATSIEDQTGREVALSNGVTASLSLRWPSFILILESLTNTEMIIVAVLMILFLLLITLIHALAQDTARLLPFLTLLFTIFAFAINIWLATALQQAATISPSRFIGFFVAFLVLVIGPPIANVSCLYLFLHRIVSNDPNFRTWLNSPHHHFKTMVMYGLTLFGAANPVLLTSKLWWRQSAAPMLPVTLARFSSLGVLSTALEGCRVVLQTVLAVMYKDATISTALPIAISGAALFLGMMSRVYAVGYIRNKDSPPIPIGGLY